MSSRHHIDDFMRGPIIGKIEEGRKITDVAKEFDIAHSVVSRQWKSFKTTGMCSRRHGGGRVRTARLFRGAVGDKFVFMDDNATCHRTLAVQDCLDSEGIQRLVRPARSPDLNPIENEWDAFGRQVTGRNYPPTNKNILIRALTEEWDKLPQQLLDNIVCKVCCPVIEHATGPPAPDSSKKYGPRIKDVENPHHTVTFGECSGTRKGECGLSVSQIRQL
ncbi:transposable element Tcb2 transposase [Trichonephila clavipes]|nr:transposable element Tcb2 transposase [Trichonephila clavipes]